MFKDEYQAAGNAGVAKLNLLKKNPVGYFVSAMVAGLFIAFGSFISITLAQSVSAGGAASFVKFAQSASFAAALSLIVMAGAELFTGNNFIMTAASLTGKVSWMDTVKLWVFCWFGNLVGSLLSVVAFQLTGIPTASENAVGDYFIKVSLGKVGLTPVNMIFRAILCNILVCLAVWCGVKLKSESGKLIMIFWCILVFMVCGLEHSIADMSIIGVALVNGGVSIGQYVYAILLATFGNMIGGAVFVALPYYVVAKEK